MAGIYVHIPFCRKACHYCDFHFSTSFKTKDSVLDAITLEIEMRKHEVTESVQTVYFGGGTPSLLEHDELLNIMAKINSTFVVENNAEITLEANPEDISEKTLESWKSIGVNRLSIGIQSFDDAVLTWMNRNHSAKQAIDSVNLSKEFGFENISIDLIYGVPKRTLDDWKNELDTAVSLKTPHISSYCLTIEPQTAFGKRSLTGEVLSHEPEISSAEFTVLISHLKHHDIHQYEVSNFSKKSMESCHNSNYWKGRPYLGVGPGAHSFKGKKRSWNISNNALYAKEIRSGVFPSKTEFLTSKDLFNEHVMTGLRRVEGINLNVIHEKFGIEFGRVYESEISALLANGLAKFTDNSFSLTQTGLLQADRITSDFFITDD